MTKLLNTALLSLIVAIPLSACKKHEPRRSPPATAAPATAAPPAPVAPAPAPASPIPPGRYIIDPVHSSVIFSARHFGAGNVYAWFREFEGTFTVDADPTKSSVELTVKVASLDSRVEKRDSHLRGPDFFNVAQFPTATFKSTRVERAADGTWSVTGNLTVRGTTRPVTARVTPLGAGKGPTGKTLAGLEARLTVNRHDFGVSFMRGALGDEIQIIIAVEGGLQ